jgi:molybdopterin molybdotransferase
VRVSTYGLQGVLPWAQARHVAQSSAHPLPAAQARLDESVGSLLARELVTVMDDPPVDSAAEDGLAVCGAGPWRVDDLDALTPGWATPVSRRMPLPRHADAVVVLEAAVVEEHADGSVTMLMRDALSGVPDEGVRPDLGAGILREASVSSAGTALAPMGTAVTPALVSLAASRGLDSLEIVRPPVVGTLILGSSLLDHGLPRNGRVRDALGAAIPAFVGALGARGNPAVRAPDTLELLTGEIDDANVDVLITTGSTAPGPDNHLRGVLRDLNVRWLVDGVSVTPGSQMLLARLVDGRFLVGLPGEPTAALAGLITLVSPLISTLCDRPRVDRRRSAVLMEDTQPADYADDTALVPVALESSAAGTQARPFPMTGPDGQIGWATADAIAIVPPGAGFRGDVVDLVDVYGRDLPALP